MPVQQPIDPSMRFASPQQQTPYQNQWGGTLDPNAYQGARFSGGNWSHKWGMRPQNYGGGFYNFFNQNPFQMEQYYNNSPVSGLLQNAFPNFYFNNNPNSYTPPAQQPYNNKFPQLPSPGQQQIPVPTGNAGNEPIVPPNKQNNPYDATGMTGSGGGYQPPKPPPIVGGGIQGGLPQVGGVQGGPPPSQPYIYNSNVSKYRKGVF